MSCKVCKAPPKWQCKGCLLSLYCDQKCQKKDLLRGHICSRIMFIAGKRKREQSTDDCAGNSKNDAGEPEDVITGDPVPEFHFDLDINGVTYCFDIEAFAKWILTSGHNLFPITQIQRYTTIDMDSVRRPKNPITNLPLTDEEILDFVKVLKIFWAQNPEKRPKTPAYYWLVFENLKNNERKEYPVSTIRNPNVMRKKLEEKYAKKLRAFLTKQRIPLVMYKNYYKIKSVWRTIGERVTFGTRVYNNDLEIDIQIPIPKLPRITEGKRAEIYTRISYNPPNISILWNLPDELSEFDVNFDNWVPRDIDASILVNGDYDDEYGAEDFWPGTYIDFIRYRMEITYFVAEHSVEVGVDTTPTLITDVRNDPRLIIFNKLSTDILPFMKHLKFHNYVLVEINFIEKE